MGSDCSLVVKNARNSCGLEADLVKLALFGTFGHSGLLKMDCLWDIARKCNPRLGDAHRTCQEVRLAAGSGPPLVAHNLLDPVINFVQVDYPNYPANGETTVVDFCFQQNLKRAQRKLGSSEGN